ncbi:MAG: GDSL-type esterase/lipase family protein [Faecalimonas sp.]|nr:GDSL-type esterase/lipase family protein [Faecalimonas sp.]
MKKTKRISAFVLVLAMLVNLVPAALTGTTAEAADSTEAVRYVSATGDDSTNDGLTEDTAYASIKQAITDLESVTADSKVVKIVGSYVWVKDEISTHTGMITITGADTDAELYLNGTDSRYIKGGALTIENIALRYGAGTQKGIYAFGNEVVIGEGVVLEAEDGTVPGSVGTIWARLGAGAYYGGTSQTAPASLTLNAGHFYDVFLGNEAIPSNTTLPGVNFTMNGGRANMIQVGASGAGKNCYTGNINITINGCDMPSYPPNLIFAGASEATITNKVDLGGNAIQVIVNNGLSINDGTIPVNATNVATAGGTLYYIKSASATDGSTLETTETTGVYQVNGGMTAVATNAADESIVYTSTASGMLTVETPGTYNVTWKKNTATVIYIDQTNGSDSNAGTEAAPVQSLKQAEALIVAAGSEQNSIKIVGEYVWKANADADFTTHTEMITVSGSDADAKLTIGGNRFIEGGPMTLENIILNYTVDEYGIYAIGNETVIGSGVTVQSSDAAKPNISQFKPILASGTHYGGKTGQTSGVQKLTLSGGRFLQVFLGDNYLSGASNVEGVNFTMNEGSTAFDIIIGGGGGTPALTYSGDVNLTFNGGNLVNTVKMTRTDVTRVDFGGNAVQIICNNGTTPTLDATIGQDRVTNRNGKYYQMNCEAVSGSGLAVTANEGVYTVVGDKLAIAVNQADKSKTYVSMDGTLTVAAEGIYTVSFVDDADYLNLGNQIVVYQDSEIDLSKEDAATVEGKVFVGWADADGNGASGSSFTAGTVLTASYIDYDPNVDLTTVGSSLYKVADPETDKESLRFCTSLSFALVGALGGGDNITYGTVYMDSETLGSNTLTKETAGVSDNKGAGNEIYITDSATVYGATVSNVSYANRSKEYTYRGYVSFADINGFTRELYTDAMTVSVSDTAQHIMERVGSKLVEAEGFKPYFMELATEYEEYIAYRTPLANTYKKLTEDKELNIVYLGGSVTAGYGSSNQDSYSWRALSGKWFKENFPDANITTVNAAIGESGTFLGTYRINEDLISQQPDLFFIEYAINDYYKGCDREVAALQYETIVREIKTAYPDCDFVTLLVTDWTAKDETTEDGDLFPEAQGHMDIAEAYGISSINVGKSLVDSLGDQSGYSSCSESAEWMEHFIDIVHPTDAGYKKYYDCLEEYLRTSLLYDIPEGSSTIALPAVQSSHLLDGNRQSYFGEQMQAIVTDSSGFTYSDALWFGSNMDTPHYGYYYSQNSDTDAYITFTFTGTEVAIWTSFYTNSKIEYTIDGGTPVEMNCHRHAPTQIITGLESGTHTIKIRPTNYADGPMMKIGAVFARDESAQTLKGATK